MLKPINCNSEHAFFFMIWGLSIGFSHARDNFSKFRHYYHRCRHCERNDILIIHRLFANFDLRWIINELSSIFSDHEYSIFCKWSIWTNLLQSILSRYIRLFVVGKLESISLYKIFQDIFPGTIHYVNCKSSFSITRSIFCSTHC